MGAEEAALRALKRALLARMPGFVAWRGGGPWRGPVHPPSCGPPVWAPSVPGARAWSFLSCRPPPSSRCFATAAVETIQGTVRAVTYRSAESGYTVLRLDRQLPGAPPLRAVGLMPSLPPGARVSLTGRWVTHEQYGRQLAVTSCASLPPQDAASWERHWQHALPGVGPVLAKALVQAFSGPGVEAALALPPSEAARRLATCRGVGLRRAERIKAAWDEDREQILARTALRALGLPPALERRAAAVLGPGAVAAVRLDAHGALLACEAPFGRADALARQLEQVPGGKADAPHLASRLAAGLLSALRDCADAKGHCFVPWVRLRDQTLRLLGARLSPEGAAEASDVDVVAIFMQRAGLLVLEDGPSRVREAESVPGLLRWPRLGATVEEIRVEVLKSFDSPASPGPDARVYLPWLHRAERGSARLLAERLSFGKLERRALSAHTESVESKKKSLLQVQHLYCDLDAILSSPSPPSSLDPDALSSGQLRAVHLASSLPLLLLTGRPGCGKTAALRAVVRAWAAAGRRVRVAAPTGRAAQQIGEVAGVEPCTVHRLLGCQVRGNKDDPGGAFSGSQSDAALAFQHHARNPLEADALLVDEASMLGLGVGHALLEALPPACQLVLVGDEDQLPSVGPGGLFGALLAARAAPVVDLRQVFRQAARSRIVAGALAVRDGLAPKFEHVEWTPEGGLCTAHASGALFPADAVLVRVPSPALVPLALGDVVQSLCFDPGAPFAPDDVQVLAPQRVGPSGTRELNALLQQLFHARQASVVGVGETGGTPSSSMLRPPSINPPKGTARAWQAGDRVLQTVNCYEKNVFNGDQGRIARVSHGDAGVALEVAFPHLEAQPLEGGGIDSGLRTYVGASLQELEWAYAITVHKAQGSEFPAIVLVLNPQHRHMLDRRLLYTAITRAKRQLVILAVEPADATLAAAAARKGPSEARWSALAPRLEAAMSADGLRRWDPEVFSAGGTDSVSGTAVREALEMAA